MGQRAWVSGRGSAGVGQRAWVNGPESAGVVHRPAGQALPEERDCDPEVGEVHEDDPEGHDDLERVLVVDVEGEDQHRDRADQDGREHRDYLLVIVKNSIFAIKKI